MCMFNVLAFFPGLRGLPQLDTVIIEVKGLSLRGDHTNICHNLELLSLVQRLRYVQDEMAW